MKRKPFIVKEVMHRYRLLKTGLGMRERKVKEKQERAYKEI